MVYDLEERTYNFAKDVRLWIKKFPKSFINVEDMKQLIRSSGSIGANYIEANEALSRKDFIMRLYPVRYHPIIYISK
jgi:four helix bundle protein